MIVNKGEGEKVREGGREGGRGGTYEDASLGDVELGGALVCSDEDSLWEQRVDEVLRDLYVLLQKVDFLLQFVSNFVRERESWEREVGER